MKIVVTGAGGYIGSVLIPKLINSGYEVVVVDRFHFGKDKLKTDNGKLTLLEEDIRFIRFDKLRNQGEINAIIDLAALSNDPLGELDPIWTYSINQLGRYRIASFGKKLGVKRYILPSSCSIYGFQDQMVDENSPVNPLTAYAKANFNAENDVMSLNDPEYNIIILRQATVYGLSPKMRFDLAINGMTKSYFENGVVNIMRNGEQWRPFVHVQDTTNAMLLMLDKDKDEVGGEIFNIGSNDQNYQIFDLAKRVATGIGLSFKYNWYGDDDTRSYRVNFDKIANLGFKTEWNAEKGASEIYQAIKSGLLDINDDKWMTLKWYKHLIEQGVQI